MPETCVNWFRIIADIERAGKHKPRIAREIGVSRAAVGRFFRSEAMPRYDVGERLIRMWMKSTKQPIDQIPRIVYSEWAR